MNELLCQPVKHVTCVAVLKWGKRSNGTVGVPRNLVSRFGNHSVLVIQRRDGFYEVLALLLRTVKCPWCKDSLKNCLVVPFGTLCSPQEEKRSFSRSNIPPDGLAEFLLVSNHVQQIILQLECPSEIVAEVMKCANLAIRSSAYDSSELCRDGEKTPGLFLNHAEVLVDANVGSGFELEIECLSFAHFQHAVSE